MNKETADKMRTLWAGAAEQDVAELWDAIVQMTDDPITAADLIAEAEQTDPAFEVSREAMDEINAVAIEASDIDDPQTVKSRLFGAIKRARG